MDPRTARFLVFIAFSLACCAAGYIARRRKWVTEHASRAVHFYTLILFWSASALIGFWELPLDRPGGLTQLFILMACQPVLMVAAALVMAPLARAIGCTRPQRGVMILAAGLSNHGFTLGAYLCYAILDPGEAAMAYGIAFVMSMILFNVLLFYPVAQHFSAAAPAPMRTLIRRSLLDVRAMPLYASALGLALNLTLGKAPALLREYYLVDLLFFLGAAGAYGGIGLRLRLGDMHGLYRQHALLAVVQFVFHPLATIGLIALLGLTAAPPGELITRVMTVEAFMPTAIVVVILSNLFHLDARFASILWTVNTAAFCLIPLPLLIWWY